MRRKKPVPVKLTHVISIVAEIERDREYRKSGAKFSALKLFTCRSGYAKVSKAHSRACQNLRAVFARNSVSYAQSIFNATPENNMRKFIFCMGLIGSSISAAHAETLANLPEAIAVKGGVAVATLHAAGAQIYVCSKNAKGALEWTFREPIAALFQDSKTVGRHFVGPTWEFADGASVVGKLVSKTPGKTAKDIPWLKLAVVEPAKSGAAAGATSILRIDTVGGVFEGACSTEGEFHSEPYSATYVFVK